MPAFSSWPGKIQAARADETVSMLDWYPTFAKLAGAEIPASAKVEGRDVWPILTRAAQKPAAPTLYWNVVQKHAVLANDWKLIVTAKEPDMPELYDLRNDPMEARNLVAESRDKLMELRAVLEKQRMLDPH